MCVSKNVEMAKPMGPNIFVAAGRNWIILTKTNVVIYDMLKSAKI